MATLPVEEIILVDEESLSKYRTVGIGASDDEEEDEEKVDSYKLKVEEELNCLSTNNNNVISNPTSPRNRSAASSRAPSPTPCPKCVKLEADYETVVGQLRSQNAALENDIARLKKEVESATKTKESVVMKYATSEMEVLKQKRFVENSEKTIKQLNNEMEMANKKQKMLSSERERLSVMIDSKVHEIDALQKEANRLNQEISSRDFKVTWTQNKLREETESHKATLQKLEEAEKALDDVKQSQLVPKEEGKEENGDESNGAVKITSDDSSSTVEYSADISGNQRASTSTASNKEFEALNEKYKSIVDENNSLSIKLHVLEQDRLDVSTKMAKLQESNSENLHQIAMLQSDLAATECLKLQLQTEKDLVVVIQNECQALRQSHSEIMGDMALCRNKEAELLGYTQQVTEKNVSLQSNFSAIEAKSFTLKEGNDHLRQELTKLETEISTMQRRLAECHERQQQEKRSAENDNISAKKVIAELQQQLDEARGEVSLLYRKLNSSVRELNKELTVARKQVKEGLSNSEGLSPSSRTSSSSSLTNGDSSFVPTAADRSPKLEDSSSQNDEQEYPMVPDQQALIERIVKLQRSLARKQDKLEFFQEHAKQLVESLQKKSKIIQAYAMSQDIESLSSNLQEQNRHEILKHKGIMASVYGSKPVDDTMTLDLSLEINRKLQVVLEDTLLRNITLKDSLNTLGKEISRLTELNQELNSQLQKLPNST